jgi:hypothetical protein
MSPSKCSYLVFTTSSQSESDSLKLELFNKALVINDNPTFLGIRFDYHLNFKNQDACIRRLNVLKIMANKSWGLSIKTLTQLYTSLICSLLEFKYYLSEICQHQLSNYRKNTIYMFENSL